jgi:hypothetical protein
MRAPLTVVLVFFATLPAAAQIVGDQWVPIGPAPIAGFFNSSATGRATAIAVNPKNADQVWVGAAAGGVWYSLNGGKNWTPESDFEDSLAIGAIALDDCSALGCPSIFVGTGENAVRRDTYYGAGLLVGGVTGLQDVSVAWTQRTGTSGVVDFRFASIVDIVLDPTTAGAAKRIWVALSSGVTSSSSGSTVTAPAPTGGYGIYRSNNRGTTWSKVAVPGSGTTQPTDLEIDPGNASTLFAGFMARGLFRTKDKGTTWCPLNKGVVQSVPAGCPAPMLPHVWSEPFDHVEIAIAPSNPQIVYASFGVCADRLIQDCVPSVWRSTNGGNTWTKRTTAVPENQPGFGIDASVYSRYTHALTVDPTNPNRVFLGGLKLWRTDDITAGATATWVESESLGAPEAFGAIIHPDHREIVFAPSKPARVYDTSDGGFHLSNSGGKTWAVGSDDLQITGFHGIATSPKTLTIIGTSQDNAGAQWEGTKEWDHLPCCGDGGSSFLDWDDPLTMYAGSNWGTVKRSTNGGDTWYDITGDWLDTVTPRLFYAPIVQAPSPVSGNHAIYFGTNQLWKNTRKHTDPADLVAIEWVAISPTLATGSFPEIVTADNDQMQAAKPNGGVNVITAIGVAKSNPDRVYIGYYGGEIFRSNGAPCYQASCWLATDPAPPNAPVTRIAVYPTNPDIAYATFSGFGNYPRVWKTIDAGKTWKPHATGLPNNIPANTIAIEHNFPVRVYVGMDSGPNGVSLFRTTDGGASWQPFGKGLPNAPIYDISIDHARDRIVAGTHGRGAFMISKPYIVVSEEVGPLPAMPVSGSGFAANQACTVTVVKADGTPCASGSVDATGGTIRTDAMGRLETVKEGYWSAKEVVWACLNGKCLGDPAGKCETVSRVAVSCGKDTATGTVTGRPSLDAPPSTWLELETGAPSTSPQSSGTLHFTATMRRGAGTESLCTVSVPYTAGQAPVDVLARIEAAVNASSACSAQRVRAVLDRGEPGPGEDEFGRPPRVYLEAPGVAGSELATAIRLQPAPNARSCVFLGGLGTPALGQLHAAKIDLLTAPEGAAGGGTVTLTERTPIGTCRVEIPTIAGQSGPQLATALAAAIQAPGIPGPHPGCPANKNARDITNRDGSLLSVYAKSLRLCSSDAKVGVDMRPNDDRVGQE